LFDNVFTQNRVVYDRSYVDPRTHSDRQYWRFSAAVQQKLVDNWSLQVTNYSYIDSRFIRHPNYQGNAFRSTPKHSGTLWGNYALPIKGLTVGGGLVFTAKRWGDDANSFTVPSYIRADLIAHYQLAPFDFRFKVENLLDKRYVSSSNYDDTVIQGNRRTVLFLVAVNSE
jgi:iron complex outermembrane receptor protein